MVKRRQQVRRQHVVSKFYLKGFAAEEKRLVRVAVDTGEGAPLSVNDATVIKDFYSVDLGDGQLDDYFERQFGLVEEAAASALRSVVGSVWPLRGEERDALATWIALQHFRSEGIRDDTTRLRAQFLRMVIGASGKERLRSHIEAVERVRCSDERLAAEWADLTQPDGTDLAPDAEEHLRDIVTHVGPTAQRITADQWSLNVFERKTLVTSDHPVTLVPPKDLPAWSGLGVGNAEGFVLPLSRSRSLVVGGSPDLPDVRCPGTAKMARLTNTATICNARRFVLRHPDDEALTNGVDWSLSVGTDSKVRGNDSWVREEGFFTGKDCRAGPVSSASDGEGARGGTLSDLEWPIPGRQFLWPDP